MSKPNRMSIKGLQEQHTVEMAEKEKEIEKLKEMLEETKKTCGERVEKEIAAREAEKNMRNEVPARSINTNLVTMSTQIEQLPLNACRIVSLKKYVSDVLYSEIKFISEEIFKGSPKIVTGAMKMMGVVSELEQLQLSEATKKEIKFQLSQRRAYSKKRVREKYNGKSIDETNLIHIYRH